VIPDYFRTARFQDALAQSNQGDFQSVYDVSKVYHHILLYPDSYDLVGLCVEDKEGREHYYHFVVVVFGLGPAGQALGRVMRPILRYLADDGVRNMVYVDDRHVVASTKLKAEDDYALTILTFKSAGWFSRSSGEI
jgi:hypothetical protein